MYSISTPVVVFDLDGTLYDKKWLALKMVMRLPRYIQLMRAERAAREVLRGRDFGSAEAFYEAFFEKISILAGKPAGYVSDWYRNTYMPAMVSVLSTEYRVRPEMAGLISDLAQRGIRVAVFSDYDFAEDKLKAIRFNLKKADAGIYDAPSMGGLKPCPQAFRRLAEAIGVGCGDITVIGDRDDTDKKGARLAGMKFIHV